MQSNTELDTTKRLLADEKGRRLAVEREAAEIKRNAEIMMAQAQALETETQNAMIEASNQLKVAMALSHGVYALGQFCNMAVIQMSGIARIIHRDGFFCQLITDLIDAVNSGNKPLIEAAINAAKIRVDIIKNQSEEVRAEIQQVSLTAFQKDISDFIYNKINEHTPVTL